MSAEPNPRRENGAYKWFIEELADIASPQYSAILSKHGHLERSNEADLPLNEKEARHKEFALNLSTAQRAVLGEMLDDANRVALHTVAAFLDWQLSVDNKLKMFFAGSEISASPYASMHYDLICILEGDTWPDE